MSELVVIANPTSRGGKAGGRLLSVERAITQQLGEHRLLCTERAGDGQRLARKACEEGARRVLVAGGDGTVSEVVSGLFEAGGEDVQLGILPLGTGSDLARLLQLGDDLEGIVRRIAAGTRRVIDVGMVRCQDPEGRPRVRHFLNIASFGLTADSVRWIDAQGKLGKRTQLSYVESGLRSLLRHRAPRVIIELDGKVVHAGELTLGAVANGQYFGNGMRVAPGARLDDGLLDLVWAEGMPRAHALALFPLLFVGQHLRDRRVHRLHGRRVELVSQQEVWLEADGEPLGILPARIELLPGALTLLGVP